MFFVCLFSKDSHRFGKNIQKAMVDIMGLFNLSKNCTKWFALLVPSNLLLLGWELFWTVNESKVCQTVDGEETESRSSWSPAETLAVYRMFLLFVFFSSVGRVYFHKGWLLKSCMFLGMKYSIIAWGHVYSNSCSFLLICIHLFLFYLKLVYFVFQNQRDKRHRLKVKY